MSIADIIIERLRLMGANGIAAPGMLCGCGDKDGWFLCESCDPNECYPAKWTLCKECPDKGKCVQWEDCETEAVAGGCYKVIPADPCFCLAVELERVSNMTLKEFDIYQHEKRCGIMSKSEVCAQKSLDNTPSLKPS